MIPERISITPPEFDWVVAYGIPSIVVIVVTIWIALFSLGNIRRAVVLSLLAITVMVGSAIAAISGELARFDSFPPPMIVMLISIIIMAFVFGFSRFGRDGVSSISLMALIGLQIFRLPLELIMHHAATREIMPMELSFSGYNFDIVTGIGALILFALLKSGRNIPTGVFWAWNLWGSFCLVGIAIIAISSSPIIRMFGDNPEYLNTWILYFPYVWLPAVLVTIAISSHIIIWRKLLSSKM